MPEHRGGRRDGHRPVRQGRPDRAGASVVTTGGQAFVIAGGMRYPVAAAKLSAVTLALGLDGRPPQSAPAVWTNLFALGPALAPLGIPGFGKAAPSLPPGATVGSVLAVGNSGQAARRYLVNAAGELEPLPDLAHALYRIGSGSTTEDLPVTPAQVTQLKVQPQRVAPRKWPTVMPTLVGDTPCARLTTTRGAQPVVALSTSAPVRSCVRPGWLPLRGTPSGDRPDRHGLRD